MENLVLSNRPPPRTRPRPRNIFDCASNVSFFDYEDEGEDEDELNPPLKAL